MRTTKIVATLGPASGTRECIAQLLGAGVNVFRLNMSHGTQDEQAARLKLVRELSVETGKPAGSLVDLQGPKIRLGLFEGGKVELKAGDTFEISTEEALGTAARASTVYKELARDVSPGDRILLADGAVELRAESTDGVTVKSRVVSGGWIGDRKGINLPGVKVSTPSLTRKDMSDLQFALDQGIDFVAMSFVRKAADIIRLRLFLEERGATIPIVAKIEKPEAWDNLNEIIAESDGVMVARGDLGVEIAFEKVPFIQKAVIERARHSGKFVITATQMLESMIESPVPTRAEVSDVANAICDGTDAVMLSAETSAGQYPVESVKTMARIALETEGAMRPRGYQDPPPRANPSIAEILADAAYHAARSANVSAIVVLTTSGSTARLVSRYRPPVPIFAFTLSENVARQLTALYGIHPIVTPGEPGTDAMIQLLDRTLVERGLLRPRDTVILVAGQPMWRSGTTNLMILHRIGEAR
ncbi:MAG: pyruvate kinase [Acidobacteria bacterium]|nr:pyruvate kinase [Acidobacteriota bacterium]